MSSGTLVPLVVDGMSTKEIRSCLKAVGHGSARRRTRASISCDLSEGVRNNPCKITSLELDWAGTAGELWRR